MIIDDPSLFFLEIHGDPPLDYLVQIYKFDSKWHGDPPLIIEQLYDE